MRQPKAWPLVALAAGLALAALALALSTGVAASSYSGSGDWVIASNATETVVAESINVTGNLTVQGTLNLFASTVTVDRNVTVAGALSLYSTSLTLTSDGPGTNIVDVRTGALLRISDLDGDPATPADGSVLRTDGAGFAGFVAPNATLNVTNSFVRDAGYAAPLPHVAGAGFSVNAGSVHVANSSFVGGFEVLVVRGTAALWVEGATFDGSAVGINVTGGTNQHLAAITFVNHTYGLLLRGTNGSNISALTVRPPQVLSYRPPGAGPAGSGLDADGCTNLTVDGLSIQGLPAPVGTLGHTGVQINNSAAVSIQQISSVWAGSVGSIILTTGVRINESVVSDSLAPLSIVLSSSVAIHNFSAQNGNSGVALSSVAGWSLEGLHTVGLSGAALVGTGLSGAGRLANATVETGPQVAALTWSAAGSFSATNITALTVAAGLTVAGPSGLPVSVDGFYGEAMTSPAVDINVARLSGLRVGDVVVNVTGATAAVALNGTELVNSLIGPLTVLEADQAALSATFRYINDTAFADILADNVSGSVMVIQAPGGLYGTTFSDLTAVNTTGVVIQLAAGVVQGITVSNVLVVDGLTVPSSAEGTVAIDASSVTGANFTQLSANRSRVALVNVTAGAPSQYTVSQVAANALSAPAVSVDCRGQQCVVSITDVTLTNALGRAVLLQHAAGGLSVSQLTTDSPWAVWGDSVSGLTVDGLDHNGTGPAVGLVDSVGVTVRNATLRGGAGLLASGGGQIGLFDSISYVNATTVEAASTAGLTVARLIFVDAGAGVRLLAVADFLGEDLSGSVENYVLFASQDARNITLRRVGMGVASGSTAGTVVSAARASGLSIQDYNFTGPCVRSASFQLVTGLDVSRFQSNACHTGVEVTGSQWVNLTALTLQDIGGNASLSITGSSDVRVQGAALQRAGGDALILGDGPRVLVSGVNGSDSFADGALLLYLQDAVVRDSVFDRASALSLFFLGAGPNLTLVNVSAQGSFQGADMFSSQGVVLDRVVLSYNFLHGFASESSSTGNTLRNLTVRGNGGTGLQIEGNGTLIVDGDFAGNGESAILSAPFIRVDWRVERSASLVDDAVNLTGDLTLMPGATFTLRRARLVIDQNARQAALQPITLINVSANSVFTIEDSSVTARDTRAPYVILVSAGGMLQWSNATVVGGNATSPLSAIRLQTASADIRGGSVSGWHLPLEATDSNVTVAGTRFQDCWTGPRVSGGTMRLHNVSSLSNEGDGFGAVGSDLVEVTNFASFNNGGAGARLESVTRATLAGFDARANDGEGLRVIGGGTLEATGLSAVGNAAEGVFVSGASSVAISGAETNSNGRSGARFDDVAFLDLTGLQADSNGGSGLLIEGSTAGAVGGASVTLNAGFGIHASGTATIDLSGVDTSENALGAVRIEGSYRASLSSSTINSLADYAVAAIGEVNVTLTDVVATATISSLIASDNAFVMALNCTLSDPIVVGSAEVRVGWNVRVVVQDASGGPGASVDVDAFDAAGDRVGGGTTGADGVLPLIAVVDHALFGDGSRLNFGPHQFQAVHATLGRARQTENITRYLTLGLRLDAQPPTLSVEFDPEPGARGWVLGAASVTLRGFDDRSDGVVLLYRLPGGQWTTVESNVSAVMVTILVEDEGVTRVEVIVRDQAGNEYGPDTVDVRVDLSPPSGSFGPAESVYFVPSFMLSWSGSDGAGSGVSSYKVEYSKNHGPYVVLLNATTLTQMEFNATDGLYEFRLTVFDVAGRSSAPAAVSVDFALLGAFRVRVLDPNGAAIANTSVQVEDLNVSLTGQGDLEITGLPSGNHTLVVSAPGFVPARLEINITPRQTLDLGEVVLQPEGGGTPVELVVLWGLLAGVGLATAGYWVYMRQKWSRKKRGGGGAGGPQG